MARRLRTSRSGLELIKSFEGFRSRAAELPNGQFVIGYGHTRSARAGLTVNRADAELILRHHDLAPIERDVADAVLAPLDQNEFDALVSLTFSIGTGAFLASDVLARLNEGKRLAAAEAFSPWRKARIDGKLCVVDALVRRRAAEKAMFLEHRMGRAAVPSALIRAELDINAALMAPNERAVIVESNFEDDRATVSKPRPRSATREDAQSAPQAAARAVAERLTRILGENGALASGTPPKRPETSPAPVRDRTDGLSVEEITKAVSELAGGEPVDEPAIEPLARPDNGPDVEAETSDADTLFVPDLPVLDEQPESDSIDPVDPKRTPANLFERRPEDGDPLPLETAGVIDDLEPLNLDDLDVQRAVAQHDEFEIEDRRRSQLSWLPFAPLSLLGLAAIVFGAQDFLSVAQPDGSIEGVNQLRFGPLLMLGGGILFIIAAYYLMRELLDRD